MEEKIKDILTSFFNSLNLDNLVEDFIQNTLGFSSMLEYLLVATDDRSVSILDRMNGYSILDGKIIPINKKNIISVTDVNIYHLNDIFLKHGSSALKESVYKKALDYLKNADLEHPCDLTSYIYNIYDELIFTGTDILETLAVNNIVPYLLNEVELPVTEVLNEVLNKLSETLDLDYDDLLETNEHDELMIAFDIIIQSVENTLSDRVGNTVHNYCRNHLTSEVRSSLLLIIYKNYKLLHEDDERVMFIM